MRDTLMFYFDFISPYAYIAWTQIHALADRHGVSVVPVPILFAAMLNANDTRGPAEIPAKRIYTFYDVARTAAHLRLPLQAPPAHPFNPLMALRVASLEMDDETRMALISALYEATWAESRGVTDPEIVEHVAASVGVKDAVARAKAPTAKQRLRDATAEAMQRGVFGVPTMMVRGELFWGYDSFPNLERFLSGAVTIDQAMVEQWRTLPASAQRKA
ncbi:MAG: 2-hydroxychromene-2-carboxylate isomerase [Myxococcota bacterium]